MIQKAEKVDIELLGDTIRYFLKRSNSTICNLCKQANVSDSTIYRILQHDASKIRRKTVEKIENYIFQF